MFAFFKLGAYKSIKLVDQVYNLLSPDEIKIAQEKCHVVSYDILNNVEKILVYDNQNDEFLYEIINQNVLDYIIFS